MMECLNFFFLDLQLNPTRQLYQKDAYSLLKETAFSLTPVLTLLASLDQTCLPNHWKTDIYAQCSRNMTTVTTLTYMCAVSYLNIAIIL